MTVGWSIGGSVGVCANAWPEEAMTAANATESAAMVLGVRFTSLLECG